jgi:hypothetical protein
MAGREVRIYKPEREARRKRNQHRALSIEHRAFENPRMIGNRMALDRILNSGTRSQASMLDA